MLLLNCIHVFVELCTPITTECSCILSVAASKASSSCPIRVS